MKPNRQQEHYNFYKICTEDTLKHSYECYLHSYSCESALIKLIAELRGFDTSNWEDFYR